jgi:hypothetical protein
MEFHGAYRMQAADPSDFCKGADKMMPSLRIPYVEFFARISAQENDAPMSSREPCGSFRE